VTDEGVVVHESDPSASSETGLGLVWGSVLWPSGIALAKYLVHRLEQQQAHQNLSFNDNWYPPQKQYQCNQSCKQDIARNRLRVLELGCGTGISGLTVAKLFPNTTHVTLTDSEPALWPILRQSIESNGVQKHTTIHGLDWRDPSTFLRPQSRATTAKCNDNLFDLVIAADVLYSGMDKLFARALASHLPSREEILELQQQKPTNGTNPMAKAFGNYANDPEALVAIPFRKDSPLQGFLDVCGRLGLALERLEDEEGRAAGAFTGTDYWNAYAKSFFVPVPAPQDASTTMRIAMQPTFSPHNQKHIQIFRITRIAGRAQDAASIRRVSRI